MVPDITLPTKVHVVKAMFFPEVTYRCDSWIMKKAECQRIDSFKPLVSFPCGSAGKESSCNVGDMGLIPGRSPREEKRLPTPVFWLGEFHGLYIHGVTKSWTQLSNFHFSNLWCWRGLLRIPWIEKRSNQSILKEINPECSLEGLMLKLQYFCFGDQPTHWKRPWCWERFRARGEGGDRGWDVFMVSIVRDREAWCAAVLRTQRVAHKLVVEQQQTEFQSENSRNARGTREKCKSSTN